MLKNDLGVRNEIFFKYASDTFSDDLLNCNSYNSCCIPTPAQSIKLNEHSKAAFSRHSPKMLEGGFFHGYKDVLINSERIS